MDADQVIRLLRMEPHPEGGHYVETWRAAPPAPGKRALCSAILFLLRRGEVSAWHRIDADELWLFHAGAPLRLSIAPSDAEGAPVDLTLGIDLVVGQRPQALVPAGAWQSARSMGDWTLVGCTVAPAFRFEGLELAPEGWSPGRDRPSDAPGALRQPTRT
jgi:hypothetical protein